MASKHELTQVEAAKRQEGNTIVRKEHIGVEKLEGAKIMKKY